MGRKAKITAVPIDQEEEIAQQVDDDEVKNDAQHMTDIINEVNAPLVTEQEEDQIDTPAAPSLAGMQPVVVAKAKAKRASKAKPAAPSLAGMQPVVVVEPEVEVTASLDEVEAVITLPLPEELKVDTKVACPDCGKQMSAKTLKYSHGPNCSSKKQKTNTDQKEEESQPNIVRNPLTEALLDHWKEQKCTRAARAVRRQEMVEKLMQNAF